MTINPLTIQPPCPHIHTITALLLPPFSSFLCHPLPPEIIPHPPPAPPVCALYPISSQQFNPFRVVPHNIINTYQLCHQSHAIGYTLVMSLLSSCHHCVTSHTNLLSNAIYLFPHSYMSGSHNAGYTTTTIRSPLCHTIIGTTVVVPQVHKNPGLCLGYLRNSLDGQVQHPAAPQTGPHLQPQLTC
jgi:hypothetical protein